MTGYVGVAGRHDKPGKVRVDIKGRTEDFVANLHRRKVPSSRPARTVVVVAEGEHGSLLVTKHEL